ncbi:hypothetical protein ACLOJK_026442 [Asimina triloba]
MCRFCDLQDELLHRHIVKNNLLKPIVEVFISNGNRYNLLNSAVLELFEYIRKVLPSTLSNLLLDFLFQKSTNVADPRRRTDVRALEKEEEDYFNGDSDEEDTASARDSNAKNQSAKSNLPNGTSDNCPSFSFVHLLCCIGRDLEALVGDDKTSTSQKKRKVTSSPGSDAESSDPVKRHRTEKNANGGAVAVASACSSCTRADPSRKKAVTPKNPPTADGMSGSGELENEKEHTVSRSSNCSSDVVDTRQSGGEEHSGTPISKSSPEMANGPGSEPYSVR